MCTGRATYASSFTISRYKITAKISTYTAAKSKNTYMYPNTITSGTISIILVLVYSAATVYGKPSTAARL